MTLKSELINGAYSQLRISGLTVDPSPEDLMVALDRMESMLAELELRNICLGYNFEDTPDPGSASLIGLGHKFGVETNLAFRLAMDFGKVIPATLVALANSGMSVLAASTADPRQVEYPRRQPVGSGNDFRYNRYQRYYRVSAQAPNDCETIRMLEGEINDFAEHFDSYLLGVETISSYTLTADTGLTIQTQALASPDVNYRVRADGTTTGNDRLLQVIIVATTSTGRIETRVINFQVEEA